MTHGGRVPSVVTTASGRSVVSTRTPRELGPSTLDPPRRLRDHGPPSGAKVCTMTDLDLELSRVVAAQAALRVSRRAAWAANATFATAVVLLTVAVIVLLAH